MKKKFPSLSRKLQRATLQSVLISLIALLLLCATVYKITFERYIKTERYFVSQLIFAEFFNLMEQGKSNGELEDYLNYLNKHQEQSHYSMLRSMRVADLMGEDQQMPPWLYNELRLDTSFLELEGFHLNFYKRIEFENKCLSCHTNATSGEIAGALKVKTHAFNQPVALGFMALMLGVMFCVIAFVCLFTLYRSSRKSLVEPIQHFVEMLRSVKSHSDLYELPTGRWDCSELAEIEEAYRSQQHQLAMAYKDIANKAEIDQLTGAYNRYKFDSLLEEFISRSKRRGEPFSLVFIDLDRFKQINDRLGHEAGDLALKFIAQQANKAARVTDQLIRLGGDEFIIMLENCSLIDAQLFVQRLRKQMDIQITYADQSFCVEFSVGLSCYPLDSPEQDELIKIADIRMYEDKEQRRSEFKKTDN